MKRLKLFLREGTNVRDNILRRLHTVTQAEPR